MPVPRAQVDGDLDRGVREALAPPPEPQPGSVRLHNAAIVLFSIAGFFLMTGILRQLKSGDQDGSSSAYQAGAWVGVFLIPGLLVGIGFLVHSATRERRTGTSVADIAWRGMWQRRLQAWRAGWLCRSCWTAFFPAGTFHPDSPATPAIPLDHFPHWVMTGTAPGRTET
ncbi:hypothetical protein ACFU7Y_39240 [Kitasatospora sp. NPDC057542]|uniref:hypothetical protein n=1 Tax=Kitasatospora sp. NPDC057542 TaxID=3346162 RepID=UPI0036BFADD4